MNRYLYCISSHIRPPSHRCSHNFEFRVKPMSQMNSECLKSPSMIPRLRHSHKLEVRKFLISSSRPTKYKKLTNLHVLYTGEGGKVEEEILINSKYQCTKMGQIGNLQTFCSHKLLKLIQCRQFTMPHKALVKSLIFNNPPPPYDISRAISEEF